ncbi:hypothetical protein V8F20_001209 [Naviculisporaceae sp. PSN 640]
MMSFQRKDITEAVLLPGNPGKPEGKAPNGNRSSFRTDNAISNARYGVERPLQRWDGGSAGEALEDSLETSGNNKAWDQFETNERKFGLKTDYNENIYTTEINKNHPEYEKRMSFADKKMREIQATAAFNPHVAEERIMDFVGGDHRDEEDKYSGVRRQQQVQDFPPLTSRENKYTPPARRAPTGNPTVKGAPVDPAIISSQLKGAPSQKPTPKEDEPKTAAPTPKAPVKPAPEGNAAEPKTEVKVEAKPTENRALDSKPDAKPQETKPVQSTGLTRPTATTSRTAGASAVPRPSPNATETVEHDVLTSFKNFALRERQHTEKMRTVKARQDKEVKLAELKNFANSFKLSTPVPKDLVSIIAKDPQKQKEIQEKALQNASEVAKQKALSEQQQAAAAAKEKEAAAPKEPQVAKPVTEQPPATQSTGAVDPRSNSRPAAPQHTSSGGMPNRHPGGRSYNNQYNQYGRNNNRPPPHMAGNQQTGNLAQRLRNVEQQKMHHQMGHPPVQDMRMPPTGPANGADQSFGRRISGVPQSYIGMGPKLNPTINEFRPGVNEFRPGAFPAVFNPVGPSQGSSPRSSINPAPEAPPPVPPVAGQLIRRKTNAVDPKKCAILSHVQKLEPPAKSKKNYEDNDGMRPSFDTPPAWRQIETEPDGNPKEIPRDSTMNLSYIEYLDKLPLTNAIATPNPAHVLPQNAHQYQLPLHLQHPSQNLTARQSPHMPPMQIHGGQHGAPVPQVPFTAPDDHRMMHSNSAQSFASPRMGQVPMAYGPAMNAPGQMQYNQQVMQPYMTPGAPPMGQYRSYSNNPQYMSQQAHHMGTPMMVQPGYMPGPGGMVASAPQVQLYPGAHPQFMPPGGVPPQPMATSNGFPSPGRPVAPMMAHQGSHQGQQPVYGMSPGMPYTQPAYTPQAAQGKFPTQRPQ